MSSRRSRFLATATLLLSLSLSQAGCYRHYLVMDPPVVGPATSKISTHHILWGLFNLSGTQALNGHCPDGVAKVVVKANGLTWLVGLFLGGLYSPTRVKIWCSYNGAAEAVVQP